MDEAEVKFWKCLLRCITAVVITIIVATAGYHTYACKKFVDGGYTMMSIPGQNQPQWIKQPTAPNQRLQP